MFREPRHLLHLSAFLLCTLDVVATYTLRSPGVMYTYSYLSASRLRCSLTGNIHASSTLPSTPMVRHLIAQMAKPTDIGALGLGWLTLSLSLYRSLILISASHCCVGLTRDSSICEITNISYLGR
jgi:hypothetical protein